MPAYIVVDLTPIDSAKLKEYSAQAAETLIPYGGEFLAKGPIQSLYGTQPMSSKVIIGFPDRDSATGWYESAAYQAIIGLRNQAMESQFHLIG